MLTQSPLVKWFGLPLAGLLAAGSAAAQVLTVSELDQGTALVVVTLPLADATTVAWPGADGAPRRVTSGGLTLAADLAEVAGDDAVLHAPAVVVAVGQAVPDELSAALLRVLAQAPPQALPAAVRRVPADGALDRRLGPPGSTASVRLELGLPAADDWRRAAAEVLWQLVPAAVGRGASSRVSGEVAVLEGRVDAESVDSEVQRWRLALARFAEDPALDSGAVEAARRRVAVRRQALLEQHPDGAEAVLDAWRQGGAAAVRQLLFGIEGVTPEAAREVAREWLGSHAGAVVVTVPPQVLNPRFATPPARVELDNDLAAAVLERPASPLSALVLQPVLTGDVDGAVAATVLARLATEMRAAADGVAGWIRAERGPARLELAAPADAFAELIEGLQAALDVVAADRSAMADAGASDPRRAALELMAGQLGLRAGGPPSAADLLRPDNLALGVVATDSEAVVEALRKFRFGGEASPPASTANLPPGSRRERVAAAGNRSCLAVALPVVGGGGDAGARADVLAALLTKRSTGSADGLEVEVLRPYVPGRDVVVLLAAADGPLDAVEGRVRESWPRWLATPTEDELATVRRRVAATTAATGSGAVGHARLVAAFAAGGARWQPATERELAILTVAPEELAADLERLRDLSQLVTAGAGVLPIVGLPGGDAVP